MSIIKNEIPILEFDTEQTAVINPTHEKLDLKLPKKCVFAFLGEYITEYASKAEAVKVSEFLSMTKRYPIYVLKYKGEEITLCEAPVGSAASAQILDYDAEGNMIAERIRPLKMRQTYKQELLYLIELCGFEVVEIYGDYHKSTEETGSLIWILRKK